jgi:hypothetical protein
MRIYLCPVITWGANLMERRLQIAQYRIHDERSGASRHGAEIQYRHRRRCAFRRGISSGPEHSRCRNAGSSY